MGAELELTALACLLVGPFSYDDAAVVECVHALLEGGADCARARVNQFYLAYLPLSISPLPPLVFGDLSWLPMAQEY